MRDDGEFGIEDEWLKSLNMPTTTNRSVWDVIMGTARGPMGMKKTGLFTTLTEDVVETVINETKGLAWGQDKPIEKINDEDDSLENKLFKVLKGKKIKQRKPDGTFEINIIEYSTDLKLKNGLNENLKYYDPGLVPDSFGNNTKDIFAIK